jgi:hypothetical protein
LLRILLELGLSRLLQGDCDRSNGLYKAGDSSVCCGDV